MAVQNRSTGPVQRYSIARSASFDLSALQKVREHSACLLLVSYVPLASMGLTMGLMPLLLRKKTRAGGEE